MPTGKKILDYLDNDFNIAVTAVVEISTWCKTKSLDWTIETILKRLADWKLAYDKGKKDGKGYTGFGK